MPRTVLFPAPFGPINEVILPRLIWKETLFTTALEPYFFEIFLTSIINVPPSIRYK